MKLRTSILSLLLIVAATPSQSSGRNGNRQVSSRAQISEIEHAANRHVVESYGKLPLSFEANQGQTDSQVKFLSRGRGYNLFLTSTEAVLELQKPGVGRQESGVRRRKSQGGSILAGPTVNSDGFQPAQPEVLDKKSTPQGVASLATPPTTSSRQTNLQPTSAPAIVRMKLVGASPSPQMTGMDELPGKSNYFIGDDPKKWRTNVPTYSRVRYQNVYPGIDLVYYGNHQQLEYDFVVAPGADPKAIRIALPGQDGEGAVSPRIDGQGDLVLAAGGSDVRLHRPSIYQETEGGAKKIAGGFVLSKGNEVGFQLARYDRTKLLIIDPSFVYSTYLGGSGPDNANAIAVDSAGNAYVAGVTGSANFPTATPAQNALAGTQNVFVAKLNPSGSTLLYSTFLGGSLNDTAWGIAVDSSGTAYVTGAAASTNFPRVNALQSVNGGQVNAFVTRLNASGSALIFSTYLGGSTADAAYAIALDSSGNAYLTGAAGSSNFPTTKGSFQPVPGSIFTSFVAKLNPTGTALQYSTFLGGTGGDIGSAIAVDASGNAYVTGQTDSSDFPTATPLQTELAIGTCGTAPNIYPCPDAFVTKLNATGSALVYSTYLGGNNSDEGYGIAVDSAGNAYITGSTSSPNFPTVNAMQPNYGGVGDAFLSKLNPQGTALVYSTFLGASGTDQGFAVAVDSSGDAAVTGVTASQFFPTLNGLQPRPGTVSAFVTKLNPAGSAFIYSTFLGGSVGDKGLGIAVDSSGSVYVAGDTFSPDFPTVNALQSVYGGGICAAPPSNTGCDDAFIAKISDANPVPTLKSITPSSTLAGGGAFSVRINGSNFVSGSVVRWNGSALATTFVSASILAASIPASDIATAGTAPVTVFNPLPGGGVSNALTFTISGGGSGGGGGNGSGPVVSSGGIVDGASFVTDAPVSPGSIISIFGSNFASSTASASSTPLPTTLLTTSATINGVPAPLYYVGSTQINAQVPFETPPGTATLVVSVNGVSSPSVTFSIAATAPGIFLYGSNRAVAVNPDGSVNASDHPAKPGDVIVVYMTGEGAVSNPPADGAPAAGSPLSLSGATTTATVGGASAPVSFSGLAPGFVGLLQVNIQVPNVAAGDQPLVVTIGGAASNSALITVASQ